MRSKKEKTKKTIKTIKRFVAIYIGPKTNMKLSGVGKIIPGRPFEVTKKIADALRFDKNFKVETEYK